MPACTLTSILQSRDHRSARVRAARRAMYSWLWFTRVQVSKVIILPIRSHGGQVATARFRTELSCHHFFFVTYSNSSILLLAPGHSQLLIIKNGTTQSVLNLVSVKDCDCLNDHSQYDHSQPEPGLPGGPCILFQSFYK
jgi:hypothetical protein